jgi:hypothetical protein
MQIRKYGIGKAKDFSAPLRNSVYRSRSQAIFKHKMELFSIFLILFEFENFVKTSVLNNKAQVES